MTVLKGLTEALHALNLLGRAQPGREALSQAAERLAEGVKAVLSHFPGEDHAAPWLRTGTLRESVTCQATDNMAVIGSSNPVAVYQELGTSSIPPRPFLAPVAAEEAGEIAHGIADLIRAALEG